MKKHSIVLACSVYFALLAPPLPPVPVSRLTSQFGCPGLPRSSLLCAPGDVTDRLPTPQCSVVLVKLTPRNVTCY